MWRWVKRFIERIKMFIRRLLFQLPFRGHSPCAPPYEPQQWNDGSEIQRMNNCYNYACNIQNNTFARPGQGSDSPFPPPYNPRTGMGGYNCDDVSAAAIADGLVPVRRDEVCFHCCFKVALVIRLFDPNNPKSGIDFHWLRHDDNGRWSQKGGRGAATDKDNAGRQIDAPENALRNGRLNRYNQFCGYFCICRDRVRIA